MSSKSESSSGGMGIIGVLTTIFVVLKLVGVIHWSWWWVLSPIWIGVAAAIAIIVLILILAAVFD